MRAMLQAAGLGLLQAQRLLGRGHWRRAVLKDTQLHGHPVSSEHNLLVRPRQNAPGWKAAHGIATGGSFLL